MSQSPEREKRPGRFGLIFLLVIDVILFGSTAAFMQAAEIAPWIISTLLFVFCLFAPVQLAATAYVQGRMRDTDNN